MEKVCAFSQIKYIFIIGFIILTKSLQVQAQEECPCGRYDDIRTASTGLDLQPPVGGECIPCPQQQSGTDACTNAHSIAINKVCNEASWSHLTKAAVAFSQSQRSGNIKAACEAAKNLNLLAGGINTRFMNSCGSALNDCVNECNTEIEKLRAQTASTPEQKALLEQKIQFAQKNQVECKSKKTQNRWGGITQIASNAEAYRSSGKCSQDAGNDDLNPLLSTTCRGFPASLQALCHQNGATEACQLYPSIPACQELNLGRDNRDNLNPNSGNERQLQLAACLQNPSSPGCKSSICNSLPTRPMRDVCNTDGVQSFCENLPSLPQCQRLTAKNTGLNCDTLPSQNLADECQTLGANDFCQKHSQLTVCKNSQKRGLASLSGGSGGSGGGLFGGGGGGSGSSDSLAKSLEDGELSPDEIAELQAKGLINADGSVAGGGYVGRGYRFAGGKFKPFDFKSLLAKKKKDQKRGISSVSPEGITHANGLTNWQKISRAMKNRYPIFFETNKPQQVQRAF